MYALAVPPRIANTIEVLVAFQELTKHKAIFLTQQSIKLFELMF